ncbi:tyrosine-protein phosphatase non-receptor type 22 isoform X1 [Alosa alosa]|uniref:tyrosine-protein phosphatase non-receptor type 22 isoform X1 n=1 Tax=Alosa alosa TaxID=278164 RepID=UPI0020154FE5|nr:tyrosine-protein phosphatase non-receptor type 22 isoform X1 [Alosa alosa]
MDPQVPILKGFLTEVACKETGQEAENSYNGEFARLKRQSTKIRTDKIFPTKAAEKQENVKKNRYKDIVPFDHSRVRITLNISNGDSDYINASFIKGVSGQKAYIATQGPLPHTVLDYWRMLWQYNVQVVVMACREFEMGRQKCERYWPANTEDLFVCEPFIVKCVSEENKGDYITRVLNVTYQSASRTIRQLHYMNWPDHGVPDSIPPILELLQEMRGYQDHEDIPICIHCSAGCGRTGALCAIDYTWNLLKRQCIPENFSIFDLVQDMRTQRPSVVQTKEQYALVYRAVRFLFEHHLDALESSCSPEPEEVNSPPSPITPDFSSDLSDFSETEVEPHIEPGPRLMQPVLCMDAPVTRSHLSQEEPEAMPSSAARRPDDILCAMAVKPPRKLRSPTPDSHDTQSIGQTHTSNSNMHTPDHQTARVTHHITQLPHSRHSSVTDDNTHHVAPCQEITHTQIHLHDSLAQHPVQVTHTPHILQIPLIQQLTHTQQRAHVTQTLVIPHMPYTPPAEPASPQLCVTVEDPYFSPVASPTGVESLAADYCFRPPLLTVNEQPLQHCSQSHTAAVVASASDDEEPPGLPERTPESFILDPNAPTDTGGPPSPAPPLPERTPESFQLLSPDELAMIMNQVKLTDSVGKVGQSSEWSGNTKTSPAVKRSWSRSKSLKVRMSLPAPPPVPLSAPIASPTYRLQESPRSLTPPLPERTPESFIVPTDDEVSRLTKTLLVVQPSNTPGSPPSPAPPLPERTAESFELPLADAALSVPGLMSTSLPEHNRRSMLCLREVRGDGQRATRCTSAIFLPDNRSLSLPRNSAPWPTGSPQLTLSVATAPCCKPGEVQLQQCSAQCNSSSINVSANPLADAQQPTVLSGSPLRMTESLSPQQRVGCSSEWAGPSQSKAQDPFMNRSKSVKVKSSKPAPLSVIAPDVAISLEAEGAPAMGASARAPTQPGSAAPENAGTEEGSRKAMTRKKSWKRFISKNKEKSAPPPAQLPPPYSAMAGLRLVFGNRLKKPKGPRTRPESWV